MPAGESFNFKPAGVNVLVDLGYEPVRGDRPNPNWLIDQADRAMYIAKKQETGRVCIQNLSGQCPSLGASLLMLPHHSGGSANYFGV